MNNNNLDKGVKSSMGYKKVNSSKSNLEQNNVEYLGMQLDTGKFNEERSKNIQKLGPSQSRLDQDREKQKAQRELMSFMRKDAIDPYDNTPGGKRVPGDKLLAISQSKYSNSLLEKILKASDQSQFQNTTLKFQEQALNYMQSISTDIKAIAESLKPKEEQQQEDEDNDLKMEMSNLAKSLASLDIEGIAKDIGSSIYKKLDSGGYGDLVKSMYQSMRETIQGGDFTQMVKGMLQSTMLSTLPPEWQKNIQQFRDDPVKLMQLQINKLGKGDNKVLRDIFGSMYQGEKPGEGLQRKKIDLSAKALFDNKVYTSITKVIPEYLYRIVRGIEGGDALMYDWQEQKYITASEVAARAANNNAQVSPEQFRREMMSSLSTILEEAVDNKNNDIIKMLEIDPQTKKVVKDKITGNVKFKNQNIGKVLTKILDSGFMVDDIITSPTNVIIQSVPGLSNDPENYQYINTIKTILKSSGMEDKDEFVELMHDLRERKNNHKYDDSAELFGNKYNSTVQHLMKNTTMSADQRDRILGMLNSQGIHVWGNGGGSGPGSGGGNGSNTFSGGGNNTTTNWDAVDAERNNPDNKIDNDRDRDKARDWESKLLHMKLSNVDPYREKESERDKFTAKLSNLYASGLIDETKYSRWKAKGPEGISSKENLYIKERLKKYKGASELYKTLEDAHMTAQHIAAQRGITVEAARAQGYVADITDLVDCVDKNGNPIIAKLREKNYTYLDPRSEDWKYIRKKASEERRGILGNGPINKQISKTLSGIFGDPKIADKAGIAVGSAAGLGVAKLLKDQGIITNPKFGYVMAGLGGALMSMERSRNFMTNVFGPEGDVKGANGFSNKEIFMAKAMTQYLPAIGIGGKTALSIMKATKAFGPMGQAFGLIAGPALGTVVGITGAAAANHFRKWLFDPERDPNSKLGKVVSFLKENRFIRRMFAMSDDRSDEALQLDALKRLRGMYESKLNEEKSKQTPSKANIQAITKAIRSIDEAETKIKENLNTIKAEQKKATKDDESPDQNRIDACNNAIATIFRHLMNKLKQIDNVVGFTAQSEFDAFVEDERNERENTNRASAAADASYNKIDSDRMDRYKEIAAEYYNASDENKARFREAVKGEGDLILDTIRDDKLRSEFEAMSIEADAGADVSARYQAWMENFKAQDPSGYEAFVEATRGGVNATEFRQKLYDAIRKDMKEVEKTNLSGQELEDEVTRRGNMILNDRHFVNKLLGVAGDTKFKIGQALRGRFGFEGADDDDKRRDNLAMNLVKMYTRNNPDYRDNTKESEIGAGGRGDKPIKMRQLSDKKFKSGESLSVAGCSVAAITNALIYMGIDAPEPDTLIGIANKYLTASGGVTSDFFKEVGKNLGLTVVTYNDKDNQFTIDSFKEIKPGKGFGAIALLRNQFNEGYHYITIKSVSGRTLQIDDPETNGITQEPAAEIVSRLVEIITLKEESAKSLVKDADSMSFKDMAKSAIKSKVTSAIKDSATLKKILSKSPSISTGGVAGGGVSTGGTSIISSILDAIKNAVFNIRIVDDLTLPLKMGDPDAALAVSKRQMSDLSDNSVKRYATNVKRMMNHKDVQAELNQQNLVQEKILNGGLVAGGSTGAGGKGTVNNSMTSAVNNINNQNGGSGGDGDKGKGGWLDAIKSDGKGFLLGLGAKAGNALTLGAAALPMLAHYAGSKISGKFFKWGKQRAEEAYSNLTGEISEEDAQQKFDENGNQTQRGRFRDWGGILRSAKDATAFVKGGIGIHGLISKSLKIGGDMLKKSSKPILKRMGESMTGNLAGNGLVKTLLNLINNALIDAPIWLAEHISAKKFSSFLGGSEMVEKAITGTLGYIKNICAKFAKKIAPAFSAKAAQVIGKKAGGSFLKKILNKVPGGILLTAAVQIPASAVTGWKHAAQYLDTKPENVTFGDKIKVMMAKVFYDCIPDILLGLMTVANPIASVCTDILLALIRGIYTFEECLVDFGLKEKEWKGDDNENVAESVDSGLNKMLADGKVDDKYVQNAKDVVGTKFTARHEGFRSTVYKDRYGNDTIGYGFNIASGRFSDEQVARWRTQGITEEEAQQVLGEELMKTRADLDKKYPWFKDLDPVRQGAMVDMAYNMGMGNDSAGLASFEKALAAMQKGDYETAAKEFLDSKYARDVGSRANEIADMIRNGSGAQGKSMGIGGSLTPPPALTSGWGSPVDGTPVVTSVFGERVVPGGSKNHKGIDIRAQDGANVYAAKAGKVTVAQASLGLIEIEHPDGTKTRYMHNKKIFVRPGDEVTKGQLIALASDIDASGGHSPYYGPHLHFEVWKNNKQIDPFIELGLSKSQLKLPGQHGGNYSNSAENIAYVERNQWLNENAKSTVQLAQANNPSGVTTNTEAAGPPDNYYPTSSNQTTIVNRDSGLEKYVQALDAKFDKMIELLTKLVNISDESVNNFMSEAIGPARI